jgi:hypothetical protein
MVLGALLTVKLKSGGAGGIAVVFELTELDVVEEVDAALEDIARLEDIEVL